MTTSASTTYISKSIFRDLPPGISQREQDVDVAVLGLGCQLSESLWRVAQRIAVLAAVSGLGCQQSESLRQFSRALLYSESLSKTSYVQSYSERSTDLTAQVETALSSLSSEGIALPRPAAVRAYLVEHPDMLDLLLSISIAAKERFAPGAELSLDVYNDPEIEDKYLTLYVRQQPYDPDILDRIERLSTDYEGDLQGKTGWLLVTTDFQAPR